MARARKNGIGAFGELSREEGIALDSYTSWAPWSRESRTGSDLQVLTVRTRGNSPGYQIIVYSIGSRGAETLSDGSSSGFNDKSNDIGVLGSGTPTAHPTPATRLLR